MSFELNENTSEITVKDLDQLIIQAFNLRSEIEVIEAVVKEKTKNLEYLNNQILEHFEKTERDKYNVKGYGTAYVNNRFVVTLPKDERRQEFFGYLKAKGIFEEMVTVHSATLNSYYQEEIKNALAAGNVEYKIPGIDEPSVIKTIRFRKS